MTYFKSFYIVAMAIGSLFVAMSPTTYSSCCDDLDCECEEFAVTNNSPVPVELEIRTCDGDVFCVEIPDSTGGHPVPVKAPRGSCIFEVHEKSTATDCPCVDGTPCYLPAASPITSISVLWCSIVIE